MAEEVLKQLEEQLNCSICLDTYVDPKLLQCFHVYCRQCLVPLVDRDQQGRLGLTCPTCRQVTPIPDNGVAGLQSAFHINRFLEIKDSFQKVKNPAATLEGAIPTPDKAAASYCSVHEGKELELYCERCEELICTRCALKGGRHHDHCYEEIQQAFEKYKVEITSSLEPMERQLTYIKRALVLLDARCGEISNQRSVTADNIHVTFAQLREALIVRETELISQLDQVTQGKLKGLAVQRDQIETNLAQLNSCLHFMRESLRPGSEGDVLKMKANTVTQVKELAAFHPDILEPNTEADTVFTASADMTAVCQSYGQVFAPGLPDPALCYIMGNVAEVAAVGEKCTAILQAINFKGESCEEPIASLDCNLVSKKTGARANCSVERRDKTQYEISYQPTIKGRHLLHVEVEGQHVKGSPFSLTAKSPTRSLGTPILTIEGVNFPWGVAVNQRGEVFVTEWGGHCVSVFSPSGEKLRSFGKLGCGLGQFLQPRGIAVDGEGNILVVGRSEDSDNYCVQKFTPEGQVVSAVSYRNSQFSDPIDVAFNPANKRIYVVDTTGHNVQVLNSDLTFFSTFGEKGSHKGQFLYPGCIACDNTGKVYVADTRNDRIQVFTAQGEFLNMFGWDDQGGDLHRPIGIAVDTAGMVYVSARDELGHRVSVLTSEGQFVTSFERWGQGPAREFACPRGVAVDNSGIVYVCDRNNSCVQVF